MDETLVFLYKGKETVTSNFVKLKVKGENDKFAELAFIFRPHLFAFLNWARRHFELVVFTASSENYAQAIVDHLDPDRKLFSMVLSRQSCMETKNGLYIKDLRIIRNRSLSKIILVDNLVHSFAFQLNNGYPILEFRGNSQDEELIHLAEFLKEAWLSNDIPTFLKENLCLGETPQEIVPDEPKTHRNKGSFVLTNAPSSKKLFSSFKQPSKVSKNEE